MTTTRTVEEEAVGVDEETADVTDGPEFSLEYVKTVLEDREDRVPNLKVLQCWSEFNICFIQIVSRPQLS